MGTQAVRPSSSDPRSAHLRRKDGVPQRWQWVSRLYASMFQNRFDVRLFITLEPTSNELGRLVVLLSEVNAGIRQLTTAYLFGKTVVTVALRLRREECLQQILETLQSAGFPCVVTELHGKEIAMR